MVLGARCGYDLWGTDSGAPTTSRRSIPIGTSGIQEIIRIHKDLDQRIENLTSGFQIAHDPHATPESMKREVSHASNRHDLRLLNLYEKYLSIEFTPYVIKKVLAALTGNEDYTPANTLPADYEKVTVDHLNAFIRVMRSLGSGHAAWAPMAQAAARHPHVADQLVEYAAQGTVDPKEAMASIRSNEVVVPSTPIVDVMDKHQTILPASRPVTL